MMSNTAQHGNISVGLHTYRPDKDEPRPDTQMHASMGSYGKYYYIDTPLELKLDRGVYYLGRYGPQDLGERERYKIGWNVYRVTPVTFEKLQKIFSISMVSLH